ncbi:MAG TPA: histidine kinase dimerization/phospho-acceptor domain-containing protein [Clostridia bacterium]|nr:histidine kinase dimerization/phospho-acceptor domain-containing protein [Clostridia bacterium]
MKKSLVKFIFMPILLTFVLMFAFQLLFASFFLNEIYTTGQLKEAENELDGFVDDYLAAREGGEGAAFLKRYQADGNKPVVILTRELDILDSTLFGTLSFLSATTDDGTEINMPVDYLRELSGIPYGMLVAGRRIRINAVRLGQSDYYEPLIISVSGESLTNRNAVRLYKKSGLDIETVDVLAYVDKIRYDLFDLREADDYLPGLLYEKLSSLLIRHEDPDAALKKLIAEPITNEHNDVYRLIYQQREIDGGQVYFVSITQTVAMKPDIRYMSVFYLFVYGAFGMMMVGIAYYLSRWLSRPLIQLNDVATKMANMDFEAVADEKYHGELGSLAKSLNMLSVGLERAMGELRLTNAQLEKEVRLKAANEMRMQRLLADLSHEFKTPLGVISGFMQVIENHKCAENEAYYFRIIDEEIERLSDMVSETIELTRLEAGVEPLKYREFELDALIESVVERFAVTLQQGGFELTLDLAPALVFADETKIERVLTNLMSNAVKYSAAKKRINLKTCRIRDDAVRVCVENFGTVSEKDLDRIWDRYYKTGTPSETRLPSDGLGLEIVKNILIRHTSEYGVYVEGEKICFHFTLPLAQGDAGGGD